MATVIDELIVTLGLDPEDFTKGQKAAAKSLVDTQDATKKASEGMGKSIRGLVAEFVGLFLVVNGVKDVIKWMTQLNAEIAQLGYTSANLGQSSAELRTWQQVAEQMGGSAEGVAQTLNSLQSSLFNKQFHGQVSEQLIDLMRLGVQLKTNAQGAVDLHQLMSDLANRVQSMPRVQANQLLMEAGIDEGLRNTIFAGPQAVERWYKREGATAKQTAASTQASQQLQQAWNDLRFSMTGIAAQVIKAIEPTLDEIFHGIAGWFGSHQGDITSGIKELFAWAQGDGPHKLISALSQMADAAVNLAKLINGVFPSGSNAIDQANAPDSGSGDLQRIGSSVRRSFGREEIVDIAHKYGVPVAALSNLPSGTDLEAAAKSMAASFQRANPGAPLATQSTLGSVFGSDLGYQYGLSAGKLSPQWQDVVNQFTTKGGFAPNPNALKRINSPVATPGAAARINAGAAGPGGGPGAKQVAVSIGDVTINTQSKDATGIASDFAQLTRQKMDAALADTGQQ